MSGGNPRAVIASGSPWATSTSTRGLQYLGSSLRVQGQLRLPGNGLLLGGFILRVQGQHVAAQERVDVPDGHPNTQQQLQAQAETGAGGSPVREGGEVVSG